jgi:hypothetical protein
MFARILVLPQEWRFPASSVSSESEIFSHSLMDQARDHLDTCVTEAVRRGLHMKWNHNLSTHFLNHILSDEDRINGKSHIWRLTLTFQAVLMHVLCLSLFKLADWLSGKLARPIHSSETIFPLFKMIEDCCPITVRCISSSSSV